MKPKVESLMAYQWKRQPEAEAFLRQILRDFLERCPYAAELARRMQSETGTRFFDWIDTVTLPESASTERQLRRTGFEPAGEEMERRLFRHPEGMFPPIAVGGRVTGIAIKVESVADFLAANQLSAAIEGLPLGPLRRAMIADGAGDAVLDVVERRGRPACAVPAADSDKILTAMRHLEHFRTRPRAFQADEDGFASTSALIDDASKELGGDYTCALFFAAEREYWQRRNQAAQVQKARQDRLGLGWANHDHHTYRSSRTCFQNLVAIMEKLGLECRERFYAGREAGWGAQVMENPRAGIVVFADVDLAAEEVVGDFAHEPLAAQKTLGTVGLWCGLHGEAFLQAGMHHLECQFDFDALTQQLEAHGVGIMKPFTDFPYLRQAFTQGERWPVAPQRIDRLLSAGSITLEQAEQFRTQGAIGSHLENLERNEGYKGFNQKGVSEIIAATDPRRAGVAN